VHVEFVADVGKTEEVLDKSHKQKVGRERMERIKRMG
jgi:hypothetical protein